MVKCRLSIAEVSHSPFSSLVSDVCTKIFGEIWMLEIDRILKGHTRLCGAHILFREPDVCTGLVYNTHDEDKQPLDK